MKDIGQVDLVLELESIVSDSVLEQISGKFGLSTDALRRIVRNSAPALVAAVMAAGATAHGAEKVLAAVMAPGSNDAIAEWLQVLLASPSGLWALEAAGQLFARTCLGVSMGELGDFVADHAGVPAQSAFALNAVMTSIMSGVLKHYLLIEARMAADLTQLLADQWPLLESRLTDRLARVLGFDDVDAFRDTIPAQLRILACRQQQRAAWPPECDNDLVDPQSLSGIVSRSAYAVRGRRTWPMVVVFVASLTGAAVAALIPIHWQLPFSAHTAQVSGVPDRPSPQSPPSWSARGGCRTSVNDAISGSIITGDARNALVSSVPASAAAVLSGPALPSAHAQYSHFAFRVSRMSMLALSAIVATDDDKERLLHDVGLSMGSRNFTADVTVDPAVRAQWMGHLQALIPLMRVPRADVVIDGTHIELGGAAADLRQRWLPRMREIFGPSWQITAFDLESERAKATASFRRALDGRVHGASCEALDGVLNMQVVTFARGSGHIPATAVENLRESAHLLNLCAARRQIVRLEIQSFSDNTGDNESNLKLSVKRAEAVRTFLVQEGVPAENLIARGYGSSRPRASDLTERGRFENRRIVFVVRK
ncbi:OmpA family protein [Burkholderia sp. Ac-20345]|uniref:OmpA family protein n=1 Tax=Burkholderia sp. Ac-20345 TaxID=2703891 RepID=UPI00197BC1E8|nr:OmpA family protein [Burkholderia sp. Ac-20345]MBN3778622.1 OmpA family protein [Burkholderia sp. Ac-20345]